MNTKTKIWFPALFKTALILMFVSLSFTGNAQERSEPVNDIEGIVYKTVKIGNQIWMAENLKTTKYNDGTEIPWIKDDTTWMKLTTPAYCLYDNDTANKSLYGVLYNWHAVNTKKLCPVNWHVPNKSEWMTLLGYVNENGGNLKEARTTQWYNRNEGATNTSGFTALLGGFRSSRGTYHSIRDAGFWWSATECTECDTFPEWNFNDAISFSLGRKSVGYGNQHNNKLYGYSIRCLKDK